MRGISKLLLVVAAAVSIPFTGAHLHPSLTPRHIDFLNFAAAEDHVPAKRAPSPPKFLNNRTSSFSVNGSSIPDVGWDVGESYAGSLPIGEANPDSNLFFWFFPSPNPAAKKEILLWVTGGPGCASSGELLEENGPFLWQPGVFKPVKNVWSWHELTNVVWIDQPVGSGYSDGKVTAKNEDDVAKQFMGFWKNFIDLFSMQGYKVYVTGSSYSGMYCPYIASAMLDAKNKTYFDVSGMMVFDGVYGSFAVSEEIPAVAYADSWERVFGLNDTFKKDMRATAKTCGYDEFLEKYLVFPPAGVQPWQLPGTAPDGSTTANCSLWESILTAATEVNPCFSIYAIFNTCPRQYDPIGFSDDTLYIPPGSGPAYFNRPDVKRAIHAPNKDWFFCNDGTDGPFVFINDTDLSFTNGPGSQPVLPNVIDQTKNVILAHGARDFTLIADGTLLTIQNITFGGQLGFQAKPSAPLVLPRLTDSQQTASGLGITAGGGAGVLGTVHSERGLTYLGVETSGHFISMDAPQIAFRALEVLLGRVDGFHSDSPFTTDLSGATT